MVYVLEKSCAKIAECADAAFACIAVCYGQINLCCTKIGSCFQMGYDCFSNCCDKTFCACYRSAKESN